MTKKTMYFTRYNEQQEKVEVTITYDDDEFLYGEARRLAIEALE